MGNVKEKEINVNYSASTGIPGIIPLASVKPIDLSKCERIDINIPFASRVLAGGIFFGSLAVITGTTGDGKSTFCSNLIAQATLQGYKSLIYSGEMMDGAVASSVMRIIAGPDHCKETSGAGFSTYAVEDESEDEIRSYLADKVFLVNNRTKKEALLGMIRESIKVLGVRVILIDNLMTALPVKSDLFAAQAEFVDALADIAHDENVIILLVAHPRKPSTKESTDDVNSVSGNQHIMDLADYGFKYSRISEKDNFASSVYGDPDRKLVIFKNRPVGVVCKTGIPLAYDAASQRIHELTKPVGWGWKFPGLDLDGKAPVKPIFEI